MSDNSMDLSQSNENQSSSIEPTQGRDPVQTVATGLGAVSGGLAGAVIGRLVGGRLGAAVGAVVGGVAGANVGREAAAGVDETIGGVVDEVRQTVEDIKPSVIGTVDAVKHNIEAAQPSVIGTIDSVRETIDETRPAVTEAIHAVTETIDESRPSVVGTVDAVKATVEDSRPAVQEAVQKTSESIQSSAASVADSVQGAAQSVKGAAQDAQPKMTQAMESVSDSVQETAESVKGAAQDARPKMSQAMESVSDSVQSSASSVADKVQRATQDKGTSSSISGAGTTTGMGQDVISDQPYGQSGIIEDTSPMIAEGASAGIEPMLAPDQTGVQSVDRMGQSPASRVGSISDSNDIDSIQNEFDRGILLSAQGDLIGAEAAFVEVIRVMPDSPEAHFNLGVVLFQQGREMEGKNHIQQARDLARDRGDIVAVDNLNLILQQMEAGGIV